MTKLVHPRIEYFAERVREVVARFESIAEVARITGIPVNTVSRMCQGSNEPSVFTVATFCAKLGISTDWLLGLSAGGEPTKFDLEPPQFITIEHLDVRAAAGAGSHVDVVQAESEFTFPWHFLRRLMGDRAGHAVLKSLRAKGESMEPTISDGALVLIDQTQNKMEDIPSAKAKKTSRYADIFVFFTNDGLRLKRLRRVDKEFIMIKSDNEQLSPIEMFRLNRDGALKLIGRVIWWDNRL
jgi:phage repressor protein C with HTH and peptisase S24 domain